MAEFGTQFVEKETISSDEFGETQEDRIAWLRQRGVQIEIPGEVRKTESTSGDIITVVRIPANDALPYEEITLQLSNELVGDQLNTLLRHYFSSSQHDINTSLLKKTALQQFGSQAVTMSPESIQKVAELGCVEIFSLDYPSDANGLKGVSIYLDEAGQLKSLPSNMRASKLARLCGFIDVPFVGDVFVGRTAMQRGSCGSDVKNLSFTLKEMDSQAEWMKNVENRNYELGVSRGRVEMRGGGDEGGKGGKDDTRGIVWSETMDSCEIQYTFPDGAQYSSKQIVVKFANKAVTVALKPGVAVEQSRELLSLKLAGSLSVDDCTWTVSNGVLDLHLEKSETSQQIWGTLEA